jgi:hypothetical protein
METSEIRIGNLFEIDGSIYAVTMIGEFNFSCNKLIKKATGMHTNGGQRNPIELSEEILVKAGAAINKGAITTSYSLDISKYPQSYKAIVISIQPGNVYVFIRDGDSDRRREEDDLITVFNGDIDGKLYLHWLQNLYFLTYGKELTLNF